MKRSFIFRRSRPSANDLLRAVSLTLFYPFYLPFLSGTHAFVVDGYYVAGTFSSSKSPVGFLQPKIASSGTKFKVYIGTRTGSRVDVELLGSLRCSEKTCRLKISLGSQCVRFCGQIDLRRRDKSICEDSFDLCNPCAIFLSFVSKTVAKKG